jgi:O-succinylbenzoic acid--CoA ligase
MSPRLVALDLTAGPGFVDALRAVWAAGDAALPVDQRLPQPAKQALLDALRPGAVVDGAGTEQRLEGGLPVEPGDALVVATSGTTGRPKGVVLTHSALAAHAAAVHRRLGADPAIDRWLACLPLAHVGGLGVVVRALVDAVPLTVLPGFDVDELRRARDEGGATLVSLVPTALDRVGASGFRWVVLGGSGDGTARPANVVHTYGMTETGGGIVYEGEPLDGVEVRIASAGEIELRSPTLLRCYRDNSSPLTSDGWYPTGDLGCLGADGRLDVFGRADDLIVTGGENVWPSAVEAAVGRVSGVAAVAVAGRPDPEWGARVVAYVEPAEGAQAPSLEAIRDAVCAELPAFAAPKELVVVARLPRTALGKVRRDQLA